MPLQVAASLGREGELREELVHARSEIRRLNQVPISKGPFQSLAFWAPRESLAWLEPSGHARPRFFTRDGPCLISWPSSFGSWVAQVVEEYESMDDEDRPKRGVCGAGTVGENGDADGEPDFEEVKGQVRRLSSLLMEGNEEPEVLAEYEKWEQLMSSHPEYLAERAADLQVRVEGRGLARTTSRVGLWAGGWGGGAPG